MLSDGCDKSIDTVESVRRGGGDFIASVLWQNVYIAQEFNESCHWLAARKILRYGILRMARNASKKFMVGF